MVVVPAGEFMMGSPADEKDHYDNEGPQHKVTIARPLAVSKFEVTFEQWDACVAFGACAHVPDSNLGTGQAAGDQCKLGHAQQYVAWLSEMTGRPYRLLSEAEWEYAARAGTTTAYSWGDEIGKNNANCNGCGSEWDSRQTAPVGSFAPNRSASTTCTATSGSGSRIVFTPTTKGHPTTARPGSPKASATTVSFAAVPCRLSSGPPLGPPLLVYRRRSWHRCRLSCRAAAQPLMVWSPLCSSISRPRIDLPLQVSPGDYFICKLDRDSFHTQSCCYKRSRVHSFALAVLQRCLPLLHRCLEDCGPNAPLPD